MSIMTCPRCGGFGKITEGNQYSTTGFYQTICPSCSGTVYVTDMPSKQSTQSFKCNKCGKEFVVAWVCPECQITDVRLKYGN